MNLFALAQYGVFLLVVTLLVKPVGVYLARVFTREATPPDRDHRVVDQVDQPATAYPMAAPRCTEPSANGRSAPPRWRSRRARRRRAQSAWMHRRPPRLAP
jgi:hypothetical protein